MKNIIEALEWRYATKKFDPTKKISHEDLETIKRAIQLAPSSYGLQPYTYILVEDTAKRELITAASYGQQQPKDASHLIVFAVYDKLKENHVDEYMTNIASTRGIDASTLEGFSKGIKSTSLQLPEELQFQWMAKQTYISLGILMQTVAELGIDATPMEGFDPKRVDEILDLKSKGLRSVLMCPIGYRHADDLAQHKKKVRKSEKDLFLTI